MADDDDLGGPSRRPARPLEDLQHSGLLWLINRQCFHPRGFALALHKSPDGQIIGWSLEGDGSEVWQFSDEVDDKRFEQAEKTLREHRV